MIAIPGFDILERLGVGGMAEVWKARQISLDRLVAIKVLAARFSKDSEDVKRFQQEAQAAARLKHPGIVQVYDANAVDGMYYFVMEFVAGYTVGDWLRRKGPLPEKDALVVAECVVDALSHGWDAARIVHCDIKPDNIMVDADGTVKVTDLGLARTIRGIATDRFSDEVLGTPAYMSPEQARGETDIDFRADIYSMGATLYHILTGQLLFQGEKDETVMELQVAGTVADPTDVNPRLSKGVAWLLEKMLAKNRADRHESWQSVRTDLSRVRNGMMPSSRLPPKAASTVTRSAKRVTAPIPKVHAGASASGRRVRGSGFPTGVVVLVIGVIVGLVAAVIYMAGGRAVPSGGVGPTVPPVVSGTTEDPSVRFAGIYDEVRRWIAENPTDFDGGIARYRSLMKVAAGSNYELLAARGVSEIQDQKRIAMDQVLGGLKQQAAALVREGDYVKAIQLLETYSGKFADELRAGRMEEAGRLRQAYNAMNAAQAEKVKREAAKYDAFVDRVVVALLERGVDAARQQLLAGLTDSQLAERSSDLAPVRKVIEAAAGIDQRILATFLPMQGKSVTVLLATGETKTFQLENVGDVALVGSVKMGESAFATIQIRPEELHAKERLRRMGGDDLPEVALIKGLMAFGAKAYSQTKTYFATLPEPLAERLVERVSKAELAMADVSAGPGGAPAPAPVGAAEEKGPAAGGRPPVRVADRQERPIPLGRVDAEVGKVVQAFLDRNQELLENDLQLFADQRGAITRLDVRSPRIKDLGPIADLKTLRSFSCGTPDRNSEIRDVFALRALPLDRLFLPRSGVKDLTPLKGMPLVELDIRGTPVTDLDPLKGMPLERLVISDSAVKDISALKGMSIKDLEMQGVSVRDFGVLSSLPLQRLVLAKTSFRDPGPIRNASLVELNIADTRVHQFQFLRDMPLKVLDVSGTQFKDIAVLKDKGLTRLNLSRTSVSDLGPLGGMPLVQLSVDETLVRSTAALRGMPLKGFSARGTQIDDLSFLKESPIEALNVADTLVADLSALQNVPLMTLDIQGTRVRDLEPLRKLPVKQLNCQRTKIRDFTVLKGTGIQSLWVDEVDETVKRALRGLPKLRDVNGTKWERW